MRAMRVVLLACLLACASCLSPPALPPRLDGGAHDARVDAWLPTFQVLGMDVRDGRGHLWSPTDAPRRPAIEIHFASPPQDLEAPLLVTGVADAELLDDLGATPLRASTLARAIPVETSLSGATLTLTPRAPLERGARVTLAIPAWTADRAGHRLASAYTSELGISIRADAGAQATDAWPPDGAFEVAPALAFAALRFDGTLEDPAHAVVLGDAHGALATSVMLTTCATIGWPDGVCVALVPVAPLAPGAAHTLATAAGARDATGAPVPPLTARFTTASSAPAPLTWATPACAIGETDAGTGCVRSDDESVVFRGQLSAAARVTWATEMGSGGLVAPRGTVVIRVDGRAPASALTLALEATDYAGLRSALTLPLTTTEPLPTIAITEVRADPAGPEPRQEYVELQNYGAAPVSLEGMHLADSGSAIGDELPPVSIPPGAHALVVSTDFDPDDTASGQDVAAPAGAILVRIGTSIASGGLSNAGEPLFLRDALDRWISAAPATPPPRSGVCVVRTSASRRTGEAGAFEYDAALTCTPGR